MKTSRIVRHGCFVLGWTLLWNWLTLAPATAQQSRAEQPLDLSGLVRQAMEHNPEIHAAPTPPARLSRTISSCWWTSSSLLTLQENDLEWRGEMVEHEKALARIEEIIGSLP